MKNSVHLTRSSLLLSLALTCFAPAALATPQYTLIDLGTLPTYSQSFGQSINSLGELSGTAFRGGTQYQPFRYSNGTLTGLGVLPATPAYNIGVGINVHGDIVGYAGDSPRLATLWAADGTTTSLGTLGGSQSVAWNINDAGQIVGWSNPSGTNAFHAFVYQPATLTDPATMTDLGTLGGAESQGLGINQAGDIAGYSQITGSSYYRPFVYSGGAMTALPTLGGNQGYAVDLNDGGWVTGDTEIAGSGIRHAFIWNGSVMTDLGTLGGANSYGQAINNGGEVVGFSNFYGSTNTRAFLYSGGAMLDLNTLIDPAPGWVLYRARDINDAGQITGFATLNGVERGFLLTPVPEAGTAAMLLAGLALLGGLTRRRRH